MWTKLAHHLAQFPNAVLTGLDAQGYPVSVRCVPQLDHAQQVVQITLPTEVGPLPGPAGLLGHSHNDQLWDLKSVLVIGHLKQDTGRWVFRPQRLSLGGGAGGLLGQIQTLLAARRTAQRYLDHRHLPRPAIAWDAIKALQAEAQPQALNNNRR